MRFGPQGPVASVDLRPGHVPPVGRWPHPRCSPAAPGEAASAGQERPPSEPVPRWPGFPADEARGAPGGRSSTHGHHAHGDESDSTVLAGPQAGPAAAPTGGCALRGPLSSGVTSGAPRSQPANSGWERSSLPRAGVGGTPTVGPLSGPARGQPVAAAQESRAVPRGPLGPSPSTLTKAWQGHRCPP